MYFTNSESELARAGSLSSWTQPWGMLGTSAKGDRRRHERKQKCGKTRQGSGAGHGDLLPFSAGFQGRQHLVQMLCPTGLWEVVIAEENQRSSFRFTNTPFLPCGFCTCCTLYLEWSPPSPCNAGASSVRSHFKCHPLRETFPNAPPPPHTGILHFTTLLFLHGPCQRLKLSYVWICLLTLFCASLALKQYW